MNSQINQDEKPNQRRRSTNQRRRSGNQRRRLGNQRRGFGFKTLLFLFYIETKGTFHPLKRIIILYPKGFKNQVVARVARRCKALATELPVIISRLEACCKSGKGFGNRLIQTLFKSEKSEFVTYSYPYCTIFRFKSSIKYKTVINGAVNSIIQIRDDISQKQI